MNANKMEKTDRAVAQADYDEGRLVADESGYRRYIEREGRSDTAEERKAWNALNDDLVYQELNGKKVSLAAEPAFRVRYEDGGERTRRDAWFTTLEEAQEFARAVHANAVTDMTNRRFTTRTKGKIRYAVTGSRGEVEYTYDAVKDVWTKHAWAEKA